MGPSSKIRALQVANAKLSREIQYLTERLTLCQAHSEQRAVTISDLRSKLIRDTLVDIRARIAAKLDGLLGDSFSGDYYEYEG